MHFRKASFDNFMILLILMDTLVETLFESDLRQFAENVLDFDDHLKFISTPFFRFYSTGALSSPNASP